MFRPSVAIVLAGYVLVAPQSLAAQPITSAELARYALTESAFTRFSHATRLLAKAMRADERFVREPLVAKTSMVDGDAAEVANALEGRLEAEPTLRAALFAADISAREYAVFTISLAAARLAHGFIGSGALRRVPEGIASDNVRFVAAHEQDVIALLKALHLE